MRRGRLPFIAGAIFGGVGLVLAVVAVGLLVSTLGSQRDAERTTGTVTALVEKTSRSKDSDGRYRTRTYYYPTVRYAVGGRTYTFTSSSGSSPADYEVGERVPVSYDPADPSDARVDTFASLYLAPSIMGGLGVLFLGLGVPLFVAGTKRLRRDSWIREHGSQVWADVVDVAPDLSTRINGRHPYVVHASWRDPDTGETRTAVSDLLTEDPGPRLAGRRSVLVRYDPADPNLAVIDLDAEPPLS